MTTGQPERQLCRLLPAGYPERLADAAARRDHQAVDELTDELSMRYPRLVRPRSEAGQFTTLSLTRRPSC